MKKHLCVFSLLVLGLNLFAQSNDLPRLSVGEFTVDINTERAQRDAATMRNLVESSLLLTGKYRLIAHQEIDTLMVEQRLRESSISSTQNNQLFVALPIDYIITGSINALKNGYILILRMIDVPTGLVVHDDYAVIGANSRDIYNGVQELTAKFITGLAKEEL